MLYFRQIAFRTHQTDLEAVPKWPWYRSFFASSARSSKQDRSE
jgi:hypothetical protein